MKTPWIEEMSWKEVKSGIEESGIVIMPVGSLEPWGDLPVGCDNYQLRGHMNKVVELAEDDSDIERLLILPELPIGHQPYMLDFPGTVNVSFHTLREYYKDIAESFIKHDALKFLWISGHAGNIPPIVDAGRELKEKYGALTVIDRCWETIWEEKGPAWDDPRKGHGGWDSLPLPEIPDEILEQADLKPIPKPDEIHDWEGTEDFTEPAWDDVLGVMTAKLKTSRKKDGDPRTVYMVGSWQEMAPYGGWGDPTLASKEEGHDELEIAAEHTIEIIKAIKKIEVPLESSPVDSIEKIQGQVNEEGNAESGDKE